LKLPEKNYKHGPGKVLISEAEETGTQNWSSKQLQKEFLFQIIVSDNSAMMYSTALCMEQKGSRTNLMKNSNRVSKLITK
jgi:hypothetical protein